MPQHIRISKNTVICCTFASMRHTYYTKRKAAASEHRTRSLVIVILWFI